MMILFEEAIPACTVLSLSLSLSVCVRVSVACACVIVCLYLHAKSLVAVIKLSELGI